MFLPDPTGKKRGVKSKLIWGAIAVVVLAGVFTAKPLYEYIRKKRSGDIVEQANDLVKKQQWDAAFQKLQAALQMDPTNVRANRAMASLLAKAGREEAFVYWNVIGNNGSMTTEDRLQALQLALVLKRADIGEMLVGQLLKEEPIPHDAVRGGVYLGDLKGDSAMVLKFARVALQKQPDDAAIQYVYARHLFRTGSPQDAEAAKNLLWSIIRKHPEQAAPVIQTLSTAPNLHRKELQDLLAEVSRRVNATNNFDYLELDLKARLNPAQKPKLITDAASEASKSPEKMLNFARWLNNNGDYKQTVALIKKDHALTSRDLFLVYSDALAALGSWKELGQIFINDNLPLDKVLIELYRARIEREVKNLPKAARHWEQVHHLAGNNPETLNYIARYAEKIGEAGEAKKAYLQLTKDPRHARQGYTELVRIAENQGNLQELRTIIKSMTSVFPNDPAPQNDLAYINLLLQEDIANARRTAEKLSTANPDMLAYRTTLALAYLRTNEPEKARATYTGTRFEWASALPGWQAVYVAAMGAAGETQVAKKLAPTIPQNRLKQPELNLIKPWL